MTTTQTPGFSTPVEQRQHRLHHFAGRAHQVLDDIGDPRLWAMTPAEVAESLAELEALRDRLTAFELGLVSVAEGADLAKATGCTNTAAWVRSVTGLTGRTSSGMVREAILAPTSRSPPAWPASSPSKQGSSPPS